MITRSAGVLCHISSLCGKYGIGSLGKSAYRFAFQLAKSGCKYWQILPLVQTGFGDSPYSSVACDSGNPYLIDLPALQKEGLLTKRELKAAEHRGTLDYGALYEERYATLRTAFSRFHFDGETFRAFIKQGTYEDYALFMTAKTVYGGSFCDWEEDLRLHRAEALERLRTDYHEEYLFWQFLQYEFHAQWSALKSYCNGLGLKILGDIPLYVAYDSADVWAHPELFKLDEELRPSVVAGVPPDYFSEDGQLWGNPIYDWAAHEADGYAWWHGRLERALTVYDAVRIDHFRGFDRYYEIPAGALNARGGSWRKGPGEALFRGVAGEIVAEDLGTTDDGVRALLQKTGFPGMKVLLFAFDGDPENEHLPGHIAENSVCYTGTHDNDTAAGYIRSLSAEEFVFFRSRVAQELEKQGIALALGKDGRQLSEALVQLALSSRANLAVIPVQDLLGLGSEARMNFPGKREGNWQFRLARPLPRRIVRHLKKTIKKYWR